MNNLTTNIIIKKGLQGEYHIRIEDGNQKVILASENYASKRNAKRAAAQLLKRMATDQNIRVLVEESAE